MSFFNLLKSQINLLLRAKSKANQPVTVSKEIESALAEAAEARKLAEEAKNLTSVVTIDTKLDKQIATLEKNLPKRPLDSKECLQRYGGFNSVGTKIAWADEAKNCATLLIPDDLSAKWINTLSGKPTTKIYCNRDIHIPLMLALLLLKKRGLLDELKSFDGCYSVRKQRGGESISYHSWAIAIDVNAKENPLNKTPVLSPEFVACWKEAGWVWGGDWKRPDGQHFQYVTNG